MSCRCKNECPCCDCRRKPCLREQLADANNAILSAANILLNYIDAYDLEDDDHDDCSCDDDDDDDYSCDDDSNYCNCQKQCRSTSQSNQKSSCRQKSSCSKKSKCSCENYYDNSKKYDGCCCKKSSSCGCWGRA